MQNAVRGKLVEECFAKTGAYTASCYKATMRVKLKRSKYLLSKSGVILCLLFVETHVFKDQDLHEAKPQVQQPQVLRPLLQVKAGQRTSPFFKAWVFSLTSSPMQSSALSTYRRIRRTQRKPAAAPRIRPNLSLGLPWCRAIPTGGAQQVSTETCPREHLSVDATREGKN